MKLKIHINWLFIIAVLFLTIGICFGACEGVKRGRGQELCKPNIFYAWEDNHNLVCQKPDGNFEIKVLVK